MKTSMLVGASAVLWAATSWAQPPIDGQPLGLEGDIGLTMLDRIDGFLLEETAAAPASRPRHWRRDFSTPAAYAASVEPNRRRLARLLGAVDPRTTAGSRLEMVGSAANPCGRVAEGGGVTVYAARWPVVGDVLAEGLWLRREGRTPVARVIAVPDATQTPEMLAGLCAAGGSSSLALRLAASGCEVLVPAIVDRATQKVRGATLTHREYLYRSAFEVGRHPIGYEVQTVLAAVDLWTAGTDGAALPIGVVGYGDGGFVALAAGALDARIAAVACSGHFRSRQNLWQEPLDRNLFGYLDEFGDAELAGLIAPRALVIEASRAAEVVVPPGTGGGPGRLQTPPVDEVRTEFERARRLVDGLTPPANFTLVESGGGTGPGGSDAALAAFLGRLSPSAALAAAVELTAGTLPDAAARHARVFYQLSRHNQQRLIASEEVRQQYFSRLDTKSLDRFQQSIEPYRDDFYRTVIGRFDRPLAEPNPRLRPIDVGPKLAGYEVLLDVFGGVFAYGILLVPRDLAAGQRRPVVVCQHGLEGKPRDVLAGGHAAYAGFATALAERGFIVFAPQNPYRGGDRFRTLQRKGNPLGKTLFSIIVPQHQQIVRWLGRLAFVDPARIAFYGLSYGGKSAMRIPPLVKEYCLSICSADFNDWIWKCASIDNRYTYTGTGEYEIFEFDLGNTFNYAEMAALVCPRPFMVERGHFDGVGPDERVAYEYAKVRHLYQAKLGIGERTAIEWFAGPHKINGVGTFAFLEQHLGRPAAALPTTSTRH